MCIGHLLWSSLFLCCSWQRIFSSLCCKYAQARVDQPTVAAVRLSRERRQRSVICLSLAFICTSSFYSSLRRIRTKYAGCTESVLFACAHPRACPSASLFTAQFSHIRRTYTSICMCLFKSRACIFSVAAFVPIFLPKLIFLSVNRPVYIYQLPFRMHLCIRPFDE